MASDKGRGAWRGTAETSGVSWFYLPKAQAAHLATALQETQGAGPGDPRVGGAWGVVWALSASPHGLVPGNWQHSKKLCGIVTQSNLVI